MLCGVAVDADRDAEAMCVKEIDDLVSEQRCIGRQREVDLLARRRGLCLSVLDQVADHCDTRKRLTAEEHDRDAIVTDGLFKQ